MKGCVSGERPTTMVFTGNVKYTSWVEMFRTQRTGVESFHRRSKGRRASADAARVAVNQEIAGTIAGITDQGDLISDIPSVSVRDLVGKPDVRVEVGEHFTLGIFSADHQEPASTLIAVLGESGFLELGIVGMNACEMLGVFKGETIRVVW